MASAYDILFTASVSRVSAPSGTITVYSSTVWE